MTAKLIKGTEIREKILEEITADVLEGGQSVVWDQAENKMHMHKAILDILLNKEI